jgi:putative ABC transport system substrate-binding protein
VVQECRAKAVTATIPVVFSIGGDPIELNLVSNLNRPDGNVTGVPFFAAQLLAKQVAPLRSMLPSASLFGVLVNPNNLRHQAGADEVQDATRTVGVKTDVVNAHGHGARGRF